MKDELKKIEQGYLLEALSPRAYGDLVYWAFERKKKIDKWMMEEIVVSIPIPFYESSDVEYLFQKYVAAAKAKEQFEKKILKVRVQAMAVRKQ